MANENTKVVDLTERVTVYSTDLDKHHKTGEAFEVHPTVAEKLVERGKATAEPQKAARGKKEEAA